jgi:hypothetical protein
VPCACHAPSVDPTQLPRPGRAQRASGYHLAVAALRRLVRSVLDGERLLLASIVVGALVAIVALALHNHRDAFGAVTDLATVTTFLFGVLLAFSIQRMRERLIRVQDLLRQCDAQFKSTAELTRCFGPEVNGEVLARIDDQLIDQIDHRLVDFHRSNDSHDRLCATVYAIEPEGLQQSNSHRLVMAVVSKMSEHRALIEAVVGQRLSAMEWSTILLLLALLLCLLVVLPGSAWLVAVLVGALAGVLVALVGLLRQLERLRWHERVTIWEPQSRLFHSLGLPPYIPRNVIGSGRFIPRGTVRVVDYPSPYPEMSDKVVVVEVLGASDPGLA